MWGPEANTPLLYEPFIHSPGGQRVVQYFDKSRMEITDPFAHDDGVWYVSNGLLVVEMVEGYYQIGLGDADRDQTPDSATVNIAGDPGQHPTYADISQFGLRAQPARSVGSSITQWFDATGIHETGPMAVPSSVTAAERLTVYGIDHTVASVFWDFMTATGSVYENGQLTTGNLFVNPYYATGYPITEAYWSMIQVAGTSRPILWQCFQRRCLTYDPSNPVEWRVEAGNVGQHYYAWRYPNSTATPAPTSTVPPPTNTPVPTNTPMPTATPTQVPPTATATSPPQQNCHPSYPDFCIPPPPPDLDCGDFWQRNFTVIGSDPHRLDADNDGIGCES
jgi:hypothetical protein